MPNKLLGQHFLRNRSVLQKLVAATGIVRGDVIIEIGPGHGELTFPLAMVCAEVGAKLVAIEKDKRLAEELKARNSEAGAGSAGGSVEIIPGDALNFLGSWLQAPGSFKIVGNIPYYLTGRLFRIISESPNRPERCVFLVQKEVGERLAARPPHMNRLAASVQYWAEPEIVARVPREDFSPVPKVDSVAILLKMRAVPPLEDRGLYFGAVRALFAQPRKTILNNLSARKDTKEKNVLAEGLGRAGIDPNCRPQDLSLEQIAEIAEMF